MNDEKAALRTAALGRRAAIPGERAEVFAARLARIGPELARAHGGRTVSAFSSFGDEVPTGPLIRALHDAGFAVVLPTTGRRGTPLTFRLWTPDVAMVKGQMGIAEPPPNAEARDPEVLFVPLAAFDRRGQRIGYGAGFYDLTLAKLRAGKTAVVAIGVGYAAQEELFIPAEPHDQPLDMVVTEKDTIVCTAAG